MQTLRYALLALAVCASSALFAEDRGTILREYWLGISGNAVSDLTADPRFPASPTGLSYLTSFATTPNWAVHRAGMHRAVI